MSVNVLYKTTATATGGRDGHAATKDGSLDVKLTTPKELGGGGGEGNNPEQLFATGYAACFLGALNGVARTEKTKLPEGTTVTASVSFADREDGVGYTIVAALSGHFPGLDAAAAEAMMQKAHAVCPYSDLIGRSHQVALSVA